MTETEEEIKIIKRCRNICYARNKDNAIAKIKKEYPGCSVSICMEYSKCGKFTDKQFMGNILYKDFNLSF